MAPVAASKRRTVPIDSSSASVRPAVASAFKVVERPPLEASRPRYSELFKLSVRLHCLLGGPLLNAQEETFLVILILGMVALVAAGAYKQIIKLTDGLPA
ncbi:hypothetical protein PLESTB_001622400 [Pleodorina starrii]|uniref:Uncharacterized protein n=1 Tax=Pleodorina starrii TaxID=330485 RepID=A0A9W6BZ48_9CHLO|nr:hypothetical protein PLESTM_002041200 [Pleodorina starrii]GLC60517.1 hypothetical protein PLESTB_001622400 [Pleodorina starrii]GLC76623.1 hypothetical protein PLESTF_001806900 [Pleodorina starrii]